jgi:hypothetical protein
VFCMLVNAPAVICCCCAGQLACAGLHTLKCLLLLLLLLLTHIPRTRCAARHTNDQNRSLPLISVRRLLVRYFWLSRSAAKDSSAACLWCVSLLRRAAGDEGGRDKCQLGDYTYCWLGPQQLRVGKEVHPTCCYGVSWFCNCCRYFVRVMVTLQRCMKHWRVLCHLAGAAHAAWTRLSQVQQ